MKRLLVVAAGGLSREVLAVERELRRYTRIRVLDDNPTTWGGTLDGEPVVGGLDLVRHFDDHDVLVGAGRGCDRRAIVRRLDELGVSRNRYVGMIHPRVRIPPCCRVGVGSIVLENVALTTNVHVGDFVVAMPHVTLTHDDVVANFATLCAGVTLGGGVRVGEEAYLGMNVAVRERTVVGSGATIGMGAAVVKDVPPGETWIGVPARRADRIELPAAAGGA